MFNQRFIARDKSWNPPTVAKASTTENRGASQFAETRTTASVLVGPCGTLWDLCPPRPPPPTRTTSQQKREEDNEVSSLWECSGFLCKLLSKKHLSEQD